MDGDRGVTSLMMVEVVVVVMSGVTLVADV